MAKDKEKIKNRKKGNQPKRNNTNGAGTDKGGKIQKKPKGPIYTIKALERSQKNLLENLSGWIDSGVTVKQKDLKDLKKFKKEIIEKIDEIVKACRIGKSTMKKS